MGPFLVLYTIGLLTGEVYLLFKLYRGSISLEIFLLTHLLSVFITFSMTLFFRRRGISASYFPLLALWVALAGPFGAIVAIAAVFIPTSRAPVDFIAWLKQQGEADRRLRLRFLSAEIRHDRFRIEGASDVMALADTLSFGAREQKLNALAAISRRFQPPLWPLLETAVGDEDPSIRVLAFAVKSKIDKQRSAEGYSRTTRINPDNNLPQPLASLNNRDLVDADNYEQSPNIIAVLRKSLSEHQGEIQTRERLSPPSD